MLQVFAHAVDQRTLPRVIYVHFIVELAKLSNWAQVEVEIEIKFCFEKIVFSFISKTIEATKFL